MVKKTIVLECDSFSISKLKKWIDNTQLTKKVKVFILTQHQRRELFNTALSGYDNLTCIDYDVIFNYQGENIITAKELYAFNQFYHKDDVPARLLDRDGYFPKYGFSTHHGFTYYNEKSYNTLNFLKDNSIDYIYFRNTPHHSVEWLLARAADFLSISIFTSERHIFPWLYSISKGYLKSRELQFENEIIEPVDDINFHIENFIKKASQDYDAAIPQYEKNRLGKGALKYYNPFKHLKEAILRPHKFYSRTNTFFNYKKLAKNINLINTDYFIFFLHYQPERTTLPDGYDFIDQVFAIRILRLLLPKHINLLVKEHPSMFTNQSEPKFRNAFFYKTIDTIDGVSLIPISVDSFQLIDNALAVATITGTVSLESYIRLKPTILFGRSKFKVNGVHVFSDTENLSVFITEILNNKIKIKPLNKELLDVCINGVVSGLSTGKVQISNYHQIRDIAETAQFKLLSKLVDAQITQY